jgi:hypothetical protein
MFKVLKNKRNVFFFIRGKEEEENDMKLFIFFLFSGYGKGGPCPSKDSWLLTIDRGQWERLGECPPTKTGATMVTVPSYSTCAGMGQSAAEASANMGAGNEPPVVVLWGGREKNPSSIRVSHLK